MLIVQTDGEGLTRKELENSAIEHWSNDGMLHDYEIYVIK